MDGNVMDNNAILLVILSFMAGLVVGAVYVNYTWHNMLRYKAEMGLRIYANDVLYEVRVYKPDE